ncbi:MAG: hypothetical protein J5487_06960, partial [Lachnospiraceae bacterium]|nr:hypothetical protein [Lachnospiraceae bacterium]
TETYPIDACPPDWNNYDLLECVDILNPPKDLLTKLSTDKLAELTLKYPLIWRVTTYAVEEMDLCFEAFERDFQIFAELLSRKDGIGVLLRKYQKSGFSVENFTEEEFPIYGFDKTVDAEIFMCQFINYYSIYFDVDNQKLADEIIEEKTAEYEKIEDTTSRIFFTFGKDLPFEKPAFLSSVLDSENKTVEAISSDNVKLVGPDDDNVALLEKSYEQKEVLWYILGFAIFLLVAGITFIILMNRKKPHSKK